MTDVHDPRTRSYNMSRIRSKNTKPELVVRSIVHRLGYRFRLHSNDLSGKPDLVFRSKHKVIFVHGCYWHRHKCKLGKVYPSTNADFWKLKFQANKLRDKKNYRRLIEHGWSYFIVWECELNNIENLVERLKLFLE